MANYLQLRHAGIWGGLPFDSGRARSNSASLAYELTRGEVPREGDFVAIPGAIKAPVGKMFSAPLATGCDCSPKATGSLDLEKTAHIAGIIGGAVALYFFLKRK